MRLLTVVPNYAEVPQEKSLCYRDNVNHVSSWRQVTLPFVAPFRILWGNTNCPRLSQIAPLRPVSDLNSWRHQTPDWRLDPPMGEVYELHLCNITIVMCFMLWLISNKKAFFYAREILCLEQSKRLIRWIVTLWLDKVAFDRDLFLDGEIKYTSNSSELTVTSGDFNKL